MNSTRCEPYTFSDNDHRRERVSCVVGITRLERELGQMSWMEVLEVDPGCLMPGSGQIQKLTVTSTDELIRALGEREYYTSRLVITAAIKSMPDFRNWLNYISFVSAGLSTSVRAVLLPSTKMYPVFAVELPYSSVHQFEGICGTLITSLKALIL